MAHSIVLVAVVTHTLGTAVDRDSLLAYLFADLSRRCAIEKGLCLDGDFLLPLFLVRPTTTIARDFSALASSTVMRKDHT